MKIKSIALLVLETGEQICFKSKNIIEIDVLTPPILFGDMSKENQTMDTLPSVKTCKIRQTGENVVDTRTLTIDGIVSAKVIHVEQIKYFEDYEQ